MTQPLTTAEVAERLLAKIDAMHIPSWDSYHAFEFKPDVVAVCHAIRAESAKRESAERELAERDSILASFNYDRGNAILRCLGQRASIAIGEEKKQKERAETAERELAKMVVLSTDAAASALQAENERLERELASAREELALWKPMNQEEAEAAYDAAEAIPISDEEINSIVERVTDPSYRPSEPEHVKLAVKVGQLQQQLGDLRRVLGEISKFAGAHHCREESCRWLHALTVDIPAMVENALAAQETQK